MLMYLETLFGFNLDEDVTKILKLLTTHTNMLFFSVNDILDAELVEENMLVIKSHLFPLQETLKFI